MFKPREGYESSLKEKFEELPKSAVSLIQTLLSIEPDKRGTATSALESEVTLANPFILYVRILMNQSFLDLPFHGSRWI